MPTSVLPQCDARLTLRLERVLLRRILKKVSRSFYLSLIILPKAVRQQVSLAYLFCRIADTIADTRILPQHSRLQALGTFREQFLSAAASFTHLERLQAMLLPYQVGEGEWQLFHHLTDCFRAFTRLSNTDQQLVRELVLTLTQGMEMDLRCFPGETAATAHALPDLCSLDLYTYYVAGVVGEFWTKMHVLHLAAWRHCAPQALQPLSIRFGQGLQMTNILKDLGKDLHNGRCYLPQEQLEQLQVQATELCQPAALGYIRPLLIKLVWYTLDHLDRACDYILRLPQRPWRARLSCMWPLLFAIQTLTVICRSEELLQPDARVKISRLSVYRTIFLSLCFLMSPCVFVKYYQHLRRRLTTTLHFYALRP
jgi:farnesyl-diphosphate farnesyltransferase